VNYLKEMGEEWKKHSEGNVSLQIYAGGVYRNEPFNVRKLNFGQLHAATLSFQGLQLILPELMVFFTPMLFRNSEEINYVLDKLKPDLEKKFEAKGYKVLTWGSLGWMYLFSKKMVKLPEELNGEKLYIWSASPLGSDMYRKSGFSTIKKDEMEVVHGLQTDMIQGFCAPPLFALSYQWFGLSKNMVDIKLAPIIGATIIKKSVWKKVGDTYRKKMLLSADVTGKKAIKRTNEFEAEALDAMVKNGLIINKISEKEVKGWEERFVSKFPEIKKNLKNPQMFNKIQQFLSEFRALKK